MKDQPIGYTSCPDCLGKGKKDDGTPCLNCKSTGCVAVYSAPSERPLDQE